MDVQLKQILQEYIKNVDAVCNKLLSEINDSEKLNLKTKEEMLLYRAGTKRMEFVYNGINFRFHGKGCMAFNETFFIDWDFGYRSRWCGIDPWKVAMTLKKNNSVYTKYYDGNLIKSECEKQVEKGMMFEEGKQYYFQVPENETFVPQFPSDYDRLVVENAQKKWSLSRSKMIDKFIRKSVKISDQFSKNADRYILRFFLGEKEIYSIFYDDLSYPEGAVKIMSDEIISHLKNSI